jgi:hypothetical protein
MTVGNKRFAGKGAREDAATTLNDPRQFGAYER